MLIITDYFNCLKFLFDRSEVSRQFNDSQDDISTLWQDKAPDFVVAVHHETEKL